MHLRIIIVQRSSTTLPKGKLATITWERLWIREPGARPKRASSRAVAVAIALETVLLRETEAAAPRLLDLWHAPRALGSAG